MRLQLEGKRSLQERSIEVKLIPYSNLTTANHVIFLSPYLTKGSHAQQQYDAAMAQAIGRARRFGQQKRVHIYQFISSKTIDVDIIEKRSSKVLKRVKAFVEN